MNKFINSIIDKIFVETPAWLWICIIHILVGAIMGTLGYVVGLALNRAVPPLIILFFALAGLMFGVYEAFRR